MGKSMSILILAHLKSMLLNILAVVLLAVIRAERPSSTLKFRRLAVTNGCVVYH